MNRYDFSKPRRSMLGKHGHRNIDIESKPTPGTERIFSGQSKPTPGTERIFSCQSKPTPGTERIFSGQKFSGSKFKSRLGQLGEKLSEESTSVKKNTALQDNFLQNAKKSLFSSGGKENKKTPNQQHNIKKVLFNSNKKENDDLYSSKRNNIVSLADVSGISDLPLFSAGRPRSLMLQRARERSQESKGNNDDYIELLKKKLTTKKTPISLKKEFSYDEKRNVTSHCFQPFNITLKPPTPPPPLYENYLKGKLKDKYAEEPLLTMTNKSKYFDGLMTPMSISKSPKLNCTNYAHKKNDYKICEINKSFEVENKKSASKRLYFNSLENLSTAESQNLMYTSSNHRSCENISTINKFPELVHTTTGCRSLQNLNNIENQMNLNYTDKNLDRTLSWENMNMLFAVETVKKAKDLIGNVEMRDDNSLNFNNSIFERNFQTEKHKSFSLNKFNGPANSTAIEESEDLEDSFVFNEIESMVEEMEDTLVKKKTAKLSVVEEEEIIKHSLSDADLTLVPSSDVQHDVSDSISGCVKFSDKSHCTDDSINQLPFRIEKMAKEIVELFDDFNLEILNELQKIFSDIIKAQTLVTSKAVQNKLEGILGSKLWIFKEHIKKQFEECVNILTHLKSTLETDDVKNRKHRLFSFMLSEAEKISEESEQLVENFQKDLVQDFKNQLLTITNESIIKETNVLSSEIKGDLETIFLGKLGAEIEQKKQHCLSHLELLKNELHKGCAPEKLRKSQELKENFDCLQTDLSSFSNLNSDLVNDFKKEILSEAHHKIMLFSKNLIEQQVTDIMNNFQTTLQEKLNLFLPKFNFQSEKWSSLKNDVVKNLDGDESTVQNSCVNSRIDDSIPCEFKTPKVRSTRKIYSELRSQFKLCLKTPEASRGRFSRLSHNHSSVLTPRTMSAIVNDQVNQIFDS